MQTVFLILVIEIFNIIAFLLGARTVQQLQRNEEIKLPNPIKAVEKQIVEYKENAELKKKQKEYDIMMENINNYDGTSAGQKDIP